MANHLFLGLAAAKRVCESKWGVIDTRGEFAIEPSFVMMRYLSASGLAPVMLPPGDPNQPPKAR